MAENYLRLLTTAGPSEFSKAGLQVKVASQGHLELVGLDSALLHRGLLGILLKTHYAPSSPQNIPFESLVTSVRAAILEDNYGSIPCELVGIKWMSNGDSGNPRAFSTATIERHYTGSIGARVGLAGVDWILFLSKEPHFEDEGPAWPPRGSFGVLHVHARAAWFPTTWQDWQPEEGEIEQLLETQPEERCPCGSGTRCGDCCHSTWLTAWHNQEYPDNR
ncbi:hypothetical protein ACFCZ3_11870 [Cellulosimicrobium cellulans]|uniref:hypothetical protein n=1 Tax=Cellulosimicrobium cellulans TaxID=1710 RepID=UPI0035D9681A